MAEISAADPPPSIAQANGQACIRLDRVSKTYRRGRQTTHALDSVSLDIAEGEFISIVGPSGCGKSTLLRLIAGLIPVSDGAIHLHDRPVDRPRGEVGIVFQSPVLLDWRSVLQNVLFPIEMRGENVAKYLDSARALLAKVGLAEFEDRYPFELSGGMRQRAAIVRALVQDPVTLIMDEPFGALDALTREQMRIDLEAIWAASGKTVLFITHSIDEAVLLSDRVVVMSPRPGRIERILTVDLPRPRGLDGRRDPRFQQLSDEITEIFLSRGILRR